MNIKKMGGNANNTTRSGKEKSSLKRTSDYNTWTDEFGVIYSADRKHLICCSGSLKSYSIKEGTEFIIGRAFAGSSIETIHIPKSVHYIGEKAFWCCNNLTTIVIDKDNPVYDSRDNCNAIIETSSNTLLFGCIGTIIPSSVSVIGNDAFFQLDIPESFIIPKGVNSIMPYAFWGCQTLKTIVIPDGVAYIGECAFGDCEELITAYIPESVKEMDVLIEGIEPDVHEVFESCDKLQSIYIPEGKKDYFKKMLPEHSDLLKYKS